MSRRLLSPAVRLTALGLCLALTGCCLCGGRNRKTADSTSGRPTVGHAGRPDVQHNESARAIRRVAVMPFRAPTELTGWSVSDLFVSELLRQNRYELVERSQLSNVLGEAEVALSGLTAGQAAELGTMLGADGVILGTVGEYEMTARGGKTLPSVGISARLIDCTTGTVVWSVDYSCRARSADVTLTEHARLCVRQMVSAIGGSK
jgi:curli biogenesis system outer membrane secretion channel CsgG